MSAGALALFAGAGFGAGFQGAIKTVVPNAERHERTGMLAVAFVVSRGVASETAPSAPTESPGSGVERAHAVTRRESMRSRLGRFIGRIP